MNIGVPRLQIDSKGAITLATTLVDITGSRIKVAKHRHNTVASAVCAIDCCPTGTNIVNRQANTTGVLANQSTVLQRIVNALNAILLHCNKETRA